MKLKLKITKEILEKSSLCGAANGGGLLTENCAFAIAFRDIIPNTIVTKCVTYFQSKHNNTIGAVVHSNKQERFIDLFDLSEPVNRLLIPEQEFEVEIPDEVIEYYYQDYAVLAQKIADSKVFQPA